MYNVTTSFSFFMCTLLHVCMYNVHVHVERCTTGTALNITYRYVQHVRSGTRRLYTARHGTGSTRGRGALHVQQHVAIQPLRRGRCGNRLRIVTHLACLVALFGGAGSFCHIDQDHRQQQQQKQHFAVRALICGPCRDMFCPRPYSHLTHPRSDCASPEATACSLCGPCTEEANSLTKSAPQESQAGHHLVLTLLECKYRSNPGDDQRARAFTTANGEPHSVNAQTPI